MRIRVTHFLLVVFRFFFTSRPKKCQPNCDTHGTFFQGEFSLFLLWHVKQLLIFRTEKLSTCAFRVVSRKWIDNNSLTIRKEMKRKEKNRKQNIKSSMWSQKENVKILSPAHTLNVNRYKFATLGVTFNNKSVHVNARKSQTTTFWCIFAHVCLCMNEGSSVRKKLFCQLSMKLFSIWLSYKASTKKKHFTVYQHDESSMEIFFVRQQFSFTKHCILCTGLRF